MFSCKFFLKGRIGLEAAIVSKREEQPDRGPRTAFFVKDLNQTEQKAPPKGYR